MPDKYARLNSDREEDMERPPAADQKFRVGLADPLKDVNRSGGRGRSLIIGAVLLGLVAAIALLIWLSGGRSGRQKGGTESAQNEAVKKEDANEIELSTEAIAGAKMEIADVAERPADAVMKVTGTIEANKEQLQQVTPLVGGRVERVYVALGDRVRAGTVLAVVASPQVAQLHGKLHEAETQLALAERNLTRVQKAENRVAVLQAQARLDEAEATLNRTRRLVEMKAGAGKDLIAAETAFRSAKAEYDFQSNISLSKELQEAQAEVTTKAADAAHIRDELRALGASIPAKDDGSERGEDTSLIELRSPAAGTVSERLANPGSGIEPGKPLFTISNLGTLWAVANVPEAQVSRLRVGAQAEVRSAALGEAALSGRVTYIDPQLDEGMRSARVRVDVTNPGDKLKVGMFAEIEFKTGAPQTGARPMELAVPVDAVQQIGDRTVVFVPKPGAPGHFLVRDVELADEIGGYRRVIRGLTAGERLVTKGSFTLKTRLLRNELKEE